MLLGPKPESEKEKGEMFYYPIDTTAFESKANGFVKITIKERTLMTQGEGFLKHIYLPQPSNFSFQDGATYNGFEQGQLAKAAKIGGQALIDFITGNNQGALDSIGADRANANDVVGSAEAFSADAVAAGLAMAGGMPIVQELGFERGVAIDKGTRTRFLDNPIRSYQLQFEMAPESEKENKAIQTIIELLTTNTYASEGSNVFGLNYPPEMIVAFYHNSLPNLNMPALQPSFLQSVQVNYNPNGYGLHHDGAPESYNLNLSFTEIKRLTQEELISLRTKQKDKIRDAELYNTTLRGILEKNKEGSQGTGKTSEQLKQEFLESQGLVDKPEFI